MKTPTTLTTLLLLFCLSVLRADEEINITDFPGPPYTPILDGDTTPSPSDGTDFGNVAVGGSVTRTFRIKNNGNQNLTIVGGSIDGSSTFTIAGLPLPTDPIGPGEDETFTVTFTPTTTSTFNATVTITNSDANETLYDFAVTGSATGTPEIKVEGLDGNFNDVEIFDNQTTISAAAGTLFANTDVGSARDRFYTITNTGNSNLAINAIYDNSGHFSQTPVTANIAPGGTRQITIRFEPTAPGTHTATITLENNDSDEDPFTFNVRGTGLASEISVRGGQAQNVGISDGDNSPRLADGTDFGEVDLFGNVNANEFTIRNEASANKLLNVFSVTISGAHASDFTLAAAPAPGDDPEKINPGGTNNFFITFDPSGTGLRTALVTILNDDPDETPFTFAIEGTGTVTPEMSLTGSPGGLPQSAVANGSTVPVSINGTEFENTVVNQSDTSFFAVTNSGSAPLTLSGSSSNPRFSIQSLPASVGTGAGNTGNFRIVFSPTSRGQHTATITLDTNDPENDPFQFQVTGFARAPEIEVSGHFNDVGSAGKVIENGDSTPSQDDGTDFFSRSPSWPSSLPHEFRIRNQGDSQLTVLGGSLANDTHFTMEGLPQAPSNTVPPGGYIDFTISFLPETEGIHTTTVTLVTDDPDNGLFTFDITGEGDGDPRIEVYGRQNSDLPYSQLNNGVTTPAATHGTAFPETTVGDTAATQFQIANEGDGALLFSVASDNPVFTFGGVNASGEIPYGGNPDFFQIIFSPTTRGIHEATITITSNDDYDNEVFTFLVRGTAAGPEIEVAGLTDIADGDVTPSASDGTDYGTVDINTETITRRFTITNSGDEPLLITDVGLGGGNAFSLVDEPASATSILPFGSATFDVEFDPSAIGTATATVTIISDDFDEGLFTFSIRGEGIDGTSDPDIAVYFGATNIPSGSSTPSTRDGTDFGTATEGGPVIERTFSIVNEGGQDLRNISTATSHPDVTITGGTSSSLGAFTRPVEFTVSFSPDTPGTRNAIISITSNDPNESPYVFLVTLEVEPADPAPPTLTALDLDDGDGTATFQGTPGKTYILKTSTTLLDDWVAAPGTSPILADGNPQDFEFTFDTTADPQRFYRIEEQP